MLRQQIFCTSQIHLQKSDDLAIFNSSFMCICSAKIAKLRYFEIRKLEIADHFQDCAAKFTQFRNCVAQIRNSEIVQRNFKS